jgi:PPOX class probable F420-dependent enzyme
MATIPDGFRDLFEKPTFAHLTTMNPDGTPHATPVWIDYDADANRLLVNTVSGRRKARNAAADPTVAVSMIDSESHYRFLSVTGEVTEITAEGASEHIDSLARRYLGRDRYPKENRSERVIVRIRPDEVMNGG